MVGGARLDLVPTGRMDGEDVVEGALHAFACVGANRSQITNHKSHTHIHIHTEI